jgi:uncharacterized membrane protein YbhN (UPF0104 family)
MKDILFSVKRQKQEIGWLCVSLIVACLLNVCAILAFHTEWQELWTQLPWVVIIGIGLYALSVVLRWTVCGVKRLFKKK